MSDISSQPCKYSIYEAVFTAQEGSVLNDTWRVWGTPFKWEAFKQMTFTFRSCQLQQQVQPDV